MQNYETSKVTYKEKKRESSNDGATIHEFTRIGDKEKQRERERKRLILYN